MERPDENIQKELEELSPLLLKLKERGAGFSLPPDYFRQLQNEVLEKVQANPGASAVSWLDQLKNKLQYLFQPGWALSFASIAVLLILGALWLFQNRAVESTSISTEIAKLDRDSVKNYIQANLYQFETETLVEFASNQESQPGFDDLSPEELDQYLDEVIHELDPETLKELL